MSLDVPTAVLEAAERREMDDAQFLAVVRDSLPYAWEVVSAAAADRTDEKPFGEHEVPPPSEKERGQLLRALASTSIRGALERHFGVVLAFQNCHRVAAFAPAAVDSEIYREFISPRGQILNQSPELRDC
ncbi:SCO5389 family protein [Pseudonocardia sp. RS11V-5]|uniref:SCO5389 family protein n=1 Tax=Pseudonocardia terrae TaxID=2905831 RepID=UPI001E5DDE91|nr:SCO5389 family protein [Pseudonocardia terrae]MCE3551868.1 SCO5389 family protein [Pseudonocardia terrae]